jgi:hypothetical protein
MLFIVRLQETNSLACRRDRSDGEMLPHPLPERSAPSGLAGLQEIERNFFALPHPGKNEKPAETAGLR